MLNPYRPPQSPVADRTPSKPIPRLRVVLLAVASLTTLLLPYAGYYIHLRGFLTREQVLGAMLSAEFLQAVFTAPGDLIGMANALLVAMCIWRKKTVALVLGALSVIYVGLRGLPEPYTLLAVLLWLGVAFWSYRSGGKSETH